MKKIAVFGKPGSGKSTLGTSLASATGIKLYALDSIVFMKNGNRVNRATFDEQHENILTSDSWIIDGFGPIDSLHRRLDVADTLIYIDLPYITSYWFVIKRLLKGVFVKPEGWPDGSSVLKGTLAGWKYLRLSPLFWTTDFLKNCNKNLKTRAFIA